MNFSSFHLDTTSLDTADRSNNELIDVTEIRIH